MNAALSDAASAGSDRAVNARPSWPVRLQQRVWDAVHQTLREVGILARLCGAALFWGMRRPYRWNLLIKAMDFIGVGSLFIIMLTGFFVGMVFGLQLVDGFSKFGVQNQTGAVVGIALTRELAPVFAALMLSSRAGSAITTEIGSMRVSQQIDALVAMSVNPIQYLVVPRLLAGTLMLPALTMLFNLVGITGAWFVCVKLLNLDPGIFVDKVLWYVDAVDVSQGLIKAAVFGFVVCLIACRQGYYASGGAAGVGRATNRSVVHSAVAILLVDYVLTDILLSTLNQRGFS